MCQINRYDIDDGRCWYKKCTTIFNVFTLESTVITLSGWYVFVPTNIRAYLGRKYRYHVPPPSAGLIPPADATLINGHGRYGGGPNSTLAVINVQPNKRYRIRLVSLSCNANYTFSIDDHTLVTMYSAGYKWWADHIPTDCH